MSAMKSAEVSKTFGINQPYEFPHRVLQKPSHTGISLFEDTSETRELEKNYTDLGIEISPEELDELKTFEDFLSLHLKPSAICDVQCMLLWAEWVRFYRRERKKVPELILEKEFRNLIINRFDLSIGEDGFRGYIYPGIKYVP